MPTVRPVVDAGDDLVERVHEYAAAEGISTEVAWARLVDTGLDIHATDDTD